MTRKEISDALGGIRAEYIEEAEETEKQTKKKQKTIRFALCAAACAMLFIGVFEVKTYFSLPQQAQAGGAQEPSEAVMAAEQNEGKDTAPESGSGTEQENTEKQEDSMRDILLQLKITECTETGFTAKVVSGSKEFPDGTIVTAFYESAAEKKDGAVFYIKERKFALNDLVEAGTKALQKNAVKIYLYQESVQP